MTISEVRRLNSRYAEATIDETNEGVMARFLFFILYNKLGGSILEDMTDNMIRKIRKVMPRLEGK